MCGIAAIVAGARGNVRESALRLMQEALNHRGPDGCGLHLDTAGHGAARYGLAHTRLAILDLSRAAAQPMQRLDDGLVLSYNGEIYNFVELADELRALGHTFTSHGDTEVLLAAYRQWGIACLSRLVGMFSFLLVDEREGILVAARDPFGIKPLYYSRCADGWAFASEIKALRAVAPGPRTADVDSVIRFLRLGSTDGTAATMFADIAQLPAGHYLTMGLNEPHPRVSRYFELSLDPLTTSDLSLDEAASRLRDLLSASVQLHLRSDVTVGAALSGGLDSSSIVSLIPRVTENADLHCFTYAAQGSPLDETEWATMAASAAGATLHTTAPDSAELMGRLAAVTRAMDEPLPSTSIFAQYCVFESAHQAGVKVLLDGQGADEILGGYDRYIAARVASLARSGRLTAALHLTKSAAARGQRAGLVLMRATDYFVPAGAQTAARRVAGRPLLTPLIDPTKVDGHRMPASRWPGPRTGRHLRDRLVADLSSDTLPSLLRYEDRNSMAWSVESRVPFLTPELARFCLSLPESYLVSPEGESKTVLRRAMRGIVPDPILRRTDKIGFAPPADDWLRQRPEFARDELLKAADLLPFIAKDQLLERASLVQQGRPLSDEVWRVVFLAMWTQECDITYR